MSGADPLIDLAASHAEAEAGLNPRWLQANGRTLRGVTRVGKRNPAWSDEELAYARDNLQSLTLEEIGTTLGRSPNAIKITIVRKQIERMSKRTGYLTGNKAANALGIDVHAVMLLVKRGILPMTRLPGIRGILQIKTIRLYMWAINPEHWPYFKVERMQDRHLARLVTLAKQRWGDEWLRIGEAAELLGTSHPVLNKHILKGNIPALDWGNWWVKRSALEGVVIPRGKGHKGVSKLFTPAADQFILRSVRAGIGYDAIGRMMKKNGSTVRVRYLTTLADRERADETQ